MLAVLSLCFTFSCHVSDGGVKRWFEEQALIQYYENFVMRVRQ